MRCRVCEREKLRFYYSQGNRNQFKFYKCGNCGLVNYDLIGGTDQTKYGGKYVDPGEANNKQNITQAETFGFIKKYLREKGSVLDIGCGNGKLLLMLREEGWLVTGLELLEILANEIKSRFSIDVRLGSFLEYNGFDQKFDLVILKHVLEHLPDSILAMSKINELLKPGSYAVLEFPNIESVEFRLKRFLTWIGIHKKKYRENYVPGHCNEFSKRSFEYLLSKTGFTLVKWELYSNKSGASKLLTALNIGSKARVLIRKNNVVVS